MKLVLIDRDGVINDELPYYVKSVDELALLPGAAEGLALLAQRGFTCVVVTNQSVVGRGIITQDALNRIHEKLTGEVQAAGGRIAEFFICTDHPDRASYRRKPKPGMLIEALEKYGAAPGTTPFIGDAPTDLEAAFEAGCPRYLVMTGKGRKTLETLDPAFKPVAACADLLDAARKISERF